MPQLQITLTIKEDGQTLNGFPLVKTITVTESKGRQFIERADGGGFVELPLTDLNGLEFFFVQADQAYTMRFNDQSDAGIPMAINSLMLIMGGAIPSGATNKAALDNSSGSTANVTVIAGGS